MPISTRVPGLALLRLRNHPNHHFREALMRSRLPSLFILTCVAPVLFLAASPGHAANTDQQCAIAKLKAASKRASSKLACHQKAITLNQVADPTCLHKADLAFLNTIEKTEKKFQCTSNNTNLVNEADSCVSNLVETTAETTGTEPAGLIGITDAHNTVRSSVGVAPLVWSAELAATAQAWANQCVDAAAPAGFIDHNPNRSAAYAYYVGENIYGSTNPIPPSDAVSVWASENANYNYANNTCAGECGHYTQVVWAATQEVGCGVSSCPGLTYGHTIVCNYGPGGNTGGKPY